MQTLLRFDMLIAGSVVALFGGAGVAQGAPARPLSVSASYASPNIIVRVASGSPGAVVIALRQEGRARGAKRRVALRRGIARRVVLRDPRTRAAGCAAGRVDIVATGPSSRGRRARVVRHLALAARPGAACPRTHAARATPASGVTAPADRFGVSSHFVWFNEAYASAEMQRIKASGAHWIRDDFNWNLVEVTRGTYDWARTDNVMSAAAKTGIDVLAILTFSPTWASTDPTGAGDRNYPPRDPADYARYAAAVAARYGSHGTFWSQHPELIARPLRAVELWNEPWGKWAWKPNPNPTAYARLARGAAVAVRAKDPALKILLPADLLQVRTDGRIVPWFEMLLKADPRILQVVDALSVHPYPGPRDKSPLDDTNPRWAYSRVLATRALERAKGFDLPVWITEVGWSSADPSVGGVGEERQATYLREAVNRAFTEWKDFVPRVFVYTWSRGTGTPTDWDGNLALLRPDGSPKPALGGAAGAARRVNLGGY